MELRTGEFKTEAGERLTFGAVGRGQALLIDFGWLSHFGQAWQFAPYRSFVERLAGSRTVILHDKPGFGASAGSTGPLTVTAGAAAIEALAGHLGLARFDLMGALQAGPMAVAFAAAHPDRLDRLALYGTYVLGREMAPEQLQASLLALVRAHWGIASQTLADLWIPEGDSRAVDWFSHYQRHAAGPELAAQAIRSCYSFDVTELARAVSTPTLVLHRKGDRAVPIRLGRQAAEAIPGARFVALEGRSHLPFVGDTEPLLRELLRFLGVPPRDVTRGAPTRLTAREREVAAMVAEGLTNSQIAFRIGIAQRTAEAHVENIRAKLGLRTRAQVAAWSARGGSA